jgi:hypothetical protein
MFTLEVNLTSPMEFNQGINIQMSRPVLQGFIERQRDTERMRVCVHAQMLEYVYRALSPPT